MENKKGILGTDCPYGNENCPTCYKPTSPTPENEKLSTLVKECAICKEIHNKGTTVLTLRDNCTCECHTEPKEVCSACEYQKKTMILPDGVFHTCKPSKAVNETQKKEVAEPLLQANEWVKELIKLYADSIGYIDLNKLVAFITKTLADQKAKDKEEVIEWCDKYLEEHFSKALVALKEFLNK